MPGRTLWDILASVNDCVYYQKEYHYIYVLGLGIATVSGILKIVNEYDQEIPQSQTADNPVAP